MLRRMLTNPAYAGVRTHGREIIAEGKWKAIVEIDDGQTVQLLLKSRSKPPARRKHLLTGLAICGVCKKYVKPALPDLECVDLLDEVAAV